MKRKRTKEERERSRADSQRAFAAAAHLRELAERAQAKLDAERSGR